MEEQDEIDNLNDSPARESTDENSNSEANPSQNDSAEIKTSDNEFSDENDEQMEFDHEENRSNDSNSEIQELDNFKAETNSDMENIEECSTDLEDSKNADKSDELDSEEGETFELENKNNDSEDEYDEKDDSVVNETFEEEEEEEGNEEEAFDNFSPRMEEDAKSVKDDYDIPNPERNLEDPEEEIPKCEETNVEDHDEKIPNDEQRAVDVDVDHVDANLDIDEDSASINDEKSFKENCSDDENASKEGPSNDEKPSKDLSNDEKPPKEDNSENEKLSKEDFSDDEKPLKEDLTENESSDDSVSSNKKPEESESDDISSDISEFIGFDSAITHETTQIYKILRERRDEFTQLLKEAESKVDHESMETDDIANPELVSSSNISTSSPAIGEISREPKITEEQMSNSKRIKKKRKFFDEFDNADAEPLKRLHLAKEHETTPVIESSLSENKENFMSSDKLSVKEETLPDINASSSAFASSTPVPVKPEGKGKFDITNPDFKEPFKYGWRREVVYRFISEDGKKRSADVSYFTPQGKKLRSIKQINEHIPKDGSLHVKNFTFSKELVFRNRESELETTRFTKKMEMELLTNESDLLEVTIEKKLGLDTTLAEDQLKIKTNSKKKESQSKSKSSKNSKISAENRLHGSDAAFNKSKSNKKNKHVDDMEESSNATPKLTMPKIMLRGPNVNSNSVPKSVTQKPISMKIKLGAPKPSNQKPAAKKSKSKSDKSKSQKERREYEIDLYAGIKTGLNTSSTSQLKNNRGTPACTISCPMALGTIPTLQCTICLCLFHFQCCGLDADEVVYGYVCKNCRHSERKKENVQLPYKSLHQSAYSPKRLYPVDHYNNECNSQVSIKNTKIVDGVTTWLPSSSNIQLSANSLKNSSTSASLETQTPLVQGVLELDGRRYVIVPKQSVLSVSPNANAVTKMFAENHIDEYHRNADVSTSNIHPIGEVPNLILNPSDVNSAGVVLVPVIPSGNAGVSPQHFVNTRSPQCLYNNSSCVGNNFKLPNDLNDATACGMNLFNSLNGMNEILAKRNSTEIDYQSSLTLTNISNLYDPLLMSLKYLTVRDLLRVSMTNKFLHRIASDPYLWKTVRLKNSQIHDWEGFAKALQKHGTKRLDMRKMLCSTTPDEVTKMWISFLEVIPSVTSLEHIDFSRSPANVVGSVAATCPNLSVINALYLKSGSLVIENFAKLQNLKDLKLRGISGGIQLERSGEKLQFINKEILRELSLTSIRNLDLDVLEMISEATNLVSLEFGDCDKLPADFATNTISKLNKLEKLRLEKLQDIAPKYEFLSVIKDIPNLKSLELINIDVREGFDEALAACTNIEQFLIIPLYVSQSATTNQLILNGIKKLPDTIKCFAWGLTLELLKVTDLFMDQWQLQKGSNNSSAVKKAVGDSIPILKSVDKLQSDGDTVPTHVDILPVPKLEKMLTNLLPHSRVKVLKIPFSMTWRQCLSDCFK